MKDMKTTHNSTTSWHNVFLRVIQVYWAILDLAYSSTHEEFRLRKRIAAQDTCKAQHFFHFIRHGAPSEKKATCREGRIISLNIFGRPSSFEKQINSFSVARPKNNQKQAACPWNTVVNMKISWLYSCSLVPFSLDELWCNGLSGLFRDFVWAKYRFDPGHSCWEGVCKPLQLRAREQAQKRLKRDDPICSERFTKQNAEVIIDVEGQNSCCWDGGDVEKGDTRLVHVAWNIMKQHETILGGGFKYRGRCYS